MQAGLGLGEGLNRVLVEEGHLFVNSPGLSLGGHRAERQCPRHTKGVAGAGQTVVPPGRRLGPRRVADVLYTLGALWNFAGLCDCRPSRRAPGPMWRGGEGLPSVQPLDLSHFSPHSAACLPPPRRSLAGKGGVVWGLRRRLMESPLLGRTTAPGTHPRDLPPPGHTEGSDPVPVLRECPTHTHEEAHALESWNCGKFLCGSCKL